MNRSVEGYPSLFLAENYVQFNTLSNLCFHFSLSKSGRLVLLRHGESEFNLKNLFCGWHDTPLSKLGTLRQVVAWAGHEFTNTVIDPLYRHRTVA